jgi:hypothetical protein
VVDVDGRPLVRNRTHIKAPILCRDYHDNIEVDDIGRPETIRGETDTNVRGYCPPVQKSAILVRRDYMKQQETPAITNTSGINNTTPDGNSNTTPDGRLTTTPDGRINTTPDGNSSTTPRRPVRNTQAPRRFWDYILK